MTVGQRIQSARKKANLTQKELAERLGLATGTIQQYELGKRQPRIEQLQAIANALNIDVYDLIDGGFGALDPVLPPNMQGVNLDGAQIDENLLSYMISRLSKLDKNTVKYQRALNNILAIANFSNLTEKAYDLLEQQQIRFDSPENLAALVPGARQSTPEHRREIEKMMGKEEGYLDKMALRRDWPINQQRLVNAFDLLNDAGQQKAVERVEELTEIPKYQRQETPTETTQAPPEDTDTKPRLKARQRARKRR